jgi:hypothetical protein
MNKFYVLMVVLFILASSCQRSQFSTTTRQYKNGRVSYVNSYHKERSKTVKRKSHKKHSTKTVSQNGISSDSSKEKQSICQSEITVINPVQMQDYENLMVSTSNEPIIMMVSENRFFSKPGLVFKHKKDPVKPDRHSIGATINKRAKQVIEYKNGRKDTVRIIALSRDTLFYQLYGKPDVTISVTTDQVDTVYILKITEPLGVASTILPVFGMFPVLGIPFAVLGLVLGIISLKRINRNPSFYKREGVTYNGIFWGALGTLISGILIVLMIING